MVHCEQPLRAGGRIHAWTSATTATRSRAAGCWGEVGWEELTDGVLVAGQPNGAPSWFPCNDHPRNKASYRIAVTTDAATGPCATACCVAQASRSSRQTWVYEQAEPMATYLATVQIGRYGLVSLPTGRTCRSTSPCPRQLAAGRGPRWPASPT